MPREQYVRDVWIGAATIVFAIAYLGAIRYQVVPDSDGYDNISGRTLPYLIGATILMLGLLLSASSWRAASKAQPGGTVIVTRDRVLRAVAYAGAITLYAVGIEHIGYIITTAAALLFAMIFSGVRKPVPLALATLVVPPALYWFFHVVMQIPLPEAPFF